MICKISKKPEWKLKPINTYSKAAQDFVVAELNSQNPEVNIELSVPGTIRHILVVVANSISYAQTDYIKSGIGNNVYKRPFCKFWLFL